MMPRAPAQNQQTWELISARKLSCHKDLCRIRCNQPGMRVGKRYINSTSGTYWWLVMELMYLVILYYSQTRWSYRSLVSVFEWTVFRRAIINSLVCWFDGAGWWLVIWNSSLEAEQNVQPDSKYRLGSPSLIVLSLICRPLFSVSVKKTWENCSGRSRSFARKWFLTRHCRCQTGQETWFSLLVTVLS